MFNIGPLELMVILVVALLIVGPKRLPEVGRSIGRGLREFRRAQEEVRRTISLDLDDPAQVIGRLREPLIIPSDDERVGYVPNVVYTCGSMVHNGALIIPYAMSDMVTTFARVDLEELLSALRASPA